MAAMRDNSMPRSLLMKLQPGTPDLSGRTAPRAAPCRVNPAFRVRAGSWPRCLTGRLPSRLSALTVGLAWIGLLSATCQPLAQDTLSSEARGEALAAELRASRPVTTSGRLRLRDANGKWRAALPVQMDVSVRPHSWQSIYQVLATTNSPAEVLVVTHEESLPNRYELRRQPRGPSDPDATLALTGDAAAIPFAGSEFWLSDLGLEFLQWPGQKLLRHEMRKGRSCYVLESVNPTPDGRAYARVLSWIDVEHRGILRAEAFDRAGKLLKEFSIGSFKKVGGTWQLKSMEIRNDQTDTRTRLEFDLELPVGSHLDI
jgi:hypothetical protein